MWLILRTFPPISYRSLPSAPPAISNASKKKFSIVKIITDVSMVLISLVGCLVMIGSLRSVGIGAVVVALLVGTEIKWMTKHLQRIKTGFWRKIRRVNQPPNETDFR